MGWLGTIGSLGMALGPAIGGLVTRLYGLNNMFYLSSFCGFAAAAILHQEGKQLAHAFIAGGVNEIAALAALGDEARAFELFEMKRKRGSGRAESRRNQSCGLARRARAHEAAENLEPGVLGQG